MRASTLVSSVALAVASVSHADIFQLADCDGDGSLLLTELDAEPFADLSGLYLECADLRNANLSGADLTNANLFRADLTNADLTNANLSGANLTIAKLSGANLSGANLTNANLTNGANLSDADLTGANLTGADLAGAKLNGADLSGTFLDGTIFCPVAESTGSCCTNLGCASISESNCSAMGGTWTEGGSCDDCQPAADDCPADVDGDGTIGFSDVLVILNDWGVCP